jgi:hypothetical protein
VIATPPAPVTIVEKHDWSTVASTSKMKGKGTLQSTSTINVNCSNGFEPLGTLNGPLMAPDPGQ